MPVPRHQEVQAEGLMKPLVPVLVIAILAAWKMCDHDLPFRTRAAQSFLQPQLLLLPQIFEKRRALVNRAWPVGHGTISIWGIVLPSTDVMLGVLRRFSGIK